MKRPILFTSIALALTGCVSSNAPTLSELHPANPQAASSPVPDMKPMLMPGSQGLVLPVSTNQAGMEHEHHQHTRPSKATAKPSDHQHEHEQPEKEEKKQC